MEEAQSAIGPADERIGHHDPLVIFTVVCVLNAGTSACVVLPAFPVARLVRLCPVSEWSAIPPHHAAADNMCLVLILRLLS